MQENSFFSKYKYIKKLGSGGCGEVFLAENKTLGNLWAVKEIAKGKQTSVSGYIEPEILKRLNHPALPRICDIHEDENTVYIVEDYIEGVCLKEELEAKGRFDEQTVIDWGIQLCSVLEYLHCQKPYPIIYGDMKPHNIILTSDGFIKLIDFGVSSLISEGEDGTSREGSASKPPGKEPGNETAFIGTKGYAAPEQFLGGRTGTTADIYSLGITLIQLITGRDPGIPTEFYQKRQYEEYLSPGLFQILLKCIDRNPAMRYKTAALLMRELRYLSLHNVDIQKRNPAAVEQPLTRIIAFTGSGGCGVSTMTAAVSEYMARGPTPICIVDLSLSGRLEESLDIRKDNADYIEPSKITSNLYYVNFNHLREKIISDGLLLYRSLSQLPDTFSFIFVDMDMSLLKSTEKYLNHIFIVSDMNPYNMSELGRLLQVEGLISQCISRTSFIINKFYKGELASRNILQSILLNQDTRQLQDLIIHSKIFEIPYDQKIYFMWMYSCFGEPLKFSGITSGGFEDSIWDVISGTFSYYKRKRLRSGLKKLINNASNSGSNRRTQIT